MFWVLTWSNHEFGCHQILWQLFQTQKDYKRVNKNKRRNKLFKQPFLYIFWVKWISFQVHFESNQTNPWTFKISMAQICLLRTFPHLKSLQQLRTQLLPLRTSPPPFQLQQLPAYTIGMNTTNVNAATAEQQILDVPARWQELHHQCQRLPIHQGIVLMGDSGEKWITLEPKRELWHALESWCVAFRGFSSWVVPRIRKMHMCVRTRFMMLLALWLARGPESDSFLPDIIIIDHEKESSDSNVSCTGCMICVLNMYLLVAFKIVVPYKHYWQIHSFKNNIQATPIIPMPCHSF